MPLTPDQQAEVDALRGETYQTRRATVPALEEILYQALPVLDHGFVRVIDYMGDDAAVVQAARVSYGKGTKRTRDDAGLINYLMRNAHTSPFEMCDLKIHVKLPIFIARQWIRHRTASVNEYSARYSMLDTEFYVPEPAQLAAQSDANRQGRDTVLGSEESQAVLALLKSDAEQAFDHYHQMLNRDGDDNELDPSRSGLARELARMNLPLSAYTQWYWKVNLHNLLHFLRLRADAHAQWEIRAYADVLLDVVRKWTPLTYDAFMTYSVGGAHLTDEGLEVVRKLIAGETIDPATLKMSPREWRELKATLGITD
ncbi:MAG: FAD-dependent thymidylate synthase [Chloroflexi bacterium]|nr:FAD-dependent thymidylate synthase [Chloroflexota bacterium]MDA1173861.1 FAD-dependent thymidylate synthase [Chloroflexota bacterium]